MTSRETQLVFSSPTAFLAFGFGSGLAPKAPGTFGTLAAVPFLWLLTLLNSWQYPLALILTFALGVYLCHATSKRLGVHDHGGIVWDEFVGLWLTFYLVPLNWWTVLLGFALFRVFDILKPWPIGYFDKRVHGGFGIMLDDIIAGAFAWLVLQGILRWFF
mgnify:FL=1